jgi:hypothetical protein
MYYVVLSTTVVVWLVAVAVVRRNAQLQARAASRDLVRRVRRYHA